MNRLIPFFNIIVIIFFAEYIKAYEGNYAVTKIPLELRTNVDAVIRNNTIIFEVKSKSKAVYKEKLIVTIFNKDGQHFGKQVQWYDNLSDIEEFEGKIYNANGEEVRELSSNEIKDYSAFSSYSLYDDSRVKYVEVFHDQFPYTLEFYFEKSYDGFINWPTWYSRNSLDPIEINKFEVIIPKGETLRYWCTSDSIKPEISEGGRRFIWAAKNLKELPYEAVNEAIFDVATVVKIAPSDFEYDEHKGNMSSWKSFGDWVYNLWKDRNILPESIKPEITKCFSPDDDSKTKILKLYKYLQNNTRYVNVSLGIGGYQPFDAVYVSEKKYGDCKALSNFMITLLKEAGINAYPVLINSGSFRMPIIRDFPSNQFNHVVVAVPIENDTVWLECTSTSIPPGSIGASNENREALMITSEGGILVKTPVSTSEKNIQQKKINVTLTQISAEVNGIIEFGGNQQNDVLSIAKNRIPSDQEKWILASLEVPDVKLEKYSFKFDEDYKEQIKMNLNLILPKYITKSGKRLFFHPNLMERRTNIPKDIEERLSPIRFSYPYRDVDSIYFTLPKGYIVEAIPKEINISSSFGTFFSQIVKVSENEILYIRSLEIKDYLIPAENYSQYRNFFSEVVKSDRAQVVLVKNK